MSEKNIYELYTLINSKRALHCADVCASKADPRRKYTVPFASCVLGFKENLLAL